MVRFLFQRMSEFVFSLEIGFDVLLLVIAAKYLIHHVRGVINSSLIKGPLTEKGGRLCHDV